MRFRLTLKNPEGREHSTTTTDMGMLTYELNALSEIPELLQPGGTYLIERLPDEEEVMLHPVKRHLSRNDIRDLTDRVLVLKLRTLAGEPRIFNEMERSALIMEAVHRLEGYAGINPAEYP